VQISDTAVRQLLQDIPPGRPIIDHRL
jgi:hypothetical protein